MFPNYFFIPLVFCFINCLSQNPESSYPISSTRKLFQTAYLSVFGTIQNSNSTPLSDIEIFLNFTSYNISYRNFSDTLGAFNIADSVNDTNLILIGQIYFIDPNGIYAEKSLEVSLYIGNAFNMDLGIITLTASTTELTNISICGYIYSNNKPVSDAFVLIQPGIIEPNNGSIYNISIVNSSGYPIDMINITSIESNLTNGIAYIISSNKTGNFEFFLSDVNIRVEYQFNITAFKRYYNDSRIILTLVNISESTVLINMNALLTEGNITGRLIDKYNLPIIDVDLICKCTGGYEDLKIGLDVDEEGFFYFELTNIRMTRKKVVCNLTFQSKGFSDKFRRNITLFRSKNYTKDLKNITLKHSSVLASVYGNVINYKGEALNGVGIILNVNNPINTVNNTNENNTVGLKLNTTTNENGSFVIAFGVFLYSQINCSLFIKDNDFKTYEKIFPLNELNDYVKNFKNITLKTKKSRGKIIGLLYDSSFQVELPDLKVDLQAKSLNKNYSYISKKNGSFIFHFMLLKINNYNFNLSINSDYMNSFILEINLNKTNNFTFNETLDISRKITEMLIDGCIRPNNSNVSIYIENNNLNETIYYLSNINASIVDGCFIINSPLFEGFNYQTLMIISSDGFFNKSSIFSLNYKNHYSLHLGNISLDKRIINRVVQGVCIENSTNQTIENIDVYIYLTFEQGFERDYDIIYRSKSYEDGSFIISIENIEEFTGTAIMKLRKKDYKTVRFNVNLGNVTIIDLGNVKFIKLITID